MTIKDLKNQILLNPIPKHIAIILDGNGRWANKRGLPRTFGHKNGVSPVKQTIEACGGLGIQNLTLYTFSSENWSRPQKEINILMELLLNTLKKDLYNLKKHNIKLNVIGNIELLPISIQKTLQIVLNETKDNKNVLTLALSYGSKEEILNAVKNIALEVQNNQLSIDAITESIFEKYLFTKNLPPLDLLIRTGGEQRISNFMLWQIAYTELYFTSVLWPDFSVEHLYKAILDFQKRERRFGRTSEQLTKIPQ